MSDWQTQPTFHRGSRDFGTGFDMMARIEELEDACSHSEAMSIGYATRVKELEAELAGGSFYQEKDIDAMQARIAELEAKLREARVEGMRTALHIAEEIERQNGPLSKRGFNEKYRLGLQSAGNAMADAIRALIEKEAEDD